MLESRLGLEVVGGIEGFILEVGVGEAYIQEGHSGCAVGISLGGDVKASICSRGPGRSRREVVLTGHRWWR